MHDKMNSLPFKFNFGDEVYFINVTRNLVQKGIVRSVQSIADDKHIINSYIIQTSNTVSVGSVPESIIFHNKDELLNWAITITQAMPD